ncbi:MAG: hypothetical protein KC897_02850 [Candidatus Omnitrophica bacterium]|nr:hypothetical protein [Candidatus Omnitrophota bacterium]MCB9721918.1 hypothetical protein [Candidatus Omnitrophota bacterium]
MKFTILGYGMWQIIIGVLLFFSACMFWDCVKRDTKDFSNRFGWADGKGDKAIWLFLIIFGVKLFAVPALAYYLIERNKKVSLPWDSTPGSADKPQGNGQGDAKKS